MSPASFFFVLLLICLSVPAFEAKGIMISYQSNDADAAPDVPDGGKAAAGGIWGIFGSWASQQGWGRKKKDKNEDINEDADADDVARDILCKTYGSNICTNPQFTLGASVACCNGAVPVKRGKGHGSWKSMCGTCPDAEVSLSRRARRMAM